MMGKKTSTTRRTAPPAPAPAAADVPVVGAREPCPCGSGRRYKACHGRTAAQAAVQFVHRPFEGLTGECDWVAMREIVPAATAALTFKGKHKGRTATAATVLPLAWPGLVRQDGGVFVGLQVPGGSGDASRDIAHALELALDAEPGTPIAPTALPGAGPRLQDLLDPKAAFEVTVHPGFDFWIDESQERSAAVVDSMEQKSLEEKPTKMEVSQPKRYVPMSISLMSERRLHLERSDSRSGSSKVRFSKNRLAISKIYLYF